MGLCYGKNISVVVEDDTVRDGDDRQTPSTSTPGNEASRGLSPKKTPTDTPTRSTNSSWRSAWHRSSGTSPLPPGSSQSPARSSHGFSRRPFPPSSPEKHIKATSAKRFGSPKRKKGPTPEDVAEVDQPPLYDKNFGYSKNFTANYELDKEIGRGHFGHTCSAKVKNGELKDQRVAVKILSKTKMTTPISIQDVHREVKILKALSEGHPNLVKFYDACEDADNVYIVMELCEGGRLLDRILSRGGRYREEDAKVIVVQILSVVAYCHLQGVVHRDLKPENFLFTTRDEDAPMKLIDFGLSDFVRPDDERFNDIVGSAYYVAPEVLRRSHSMEADIWSIGVITFVLLSGRTPFWARTESQIFRAILRGGGPNYDDAPWPLVSPEAKSFVKRLLNKSYRKRMTAAQALTHPWLKGKTCSVPLDALTYKLVKSYLEATPFRRAALRALSKALTEDELVYLKAQYRLLKSHKDDGHVSLENFKMALMKNATDAMKESKVSDILITMEKQFSHAKLDFEEFCAAAISTYQLEALENWEPMVNEAFEYFELEGNRAVTVDELAWELNLSRASHSMLQEWIRYSDGKLNFLGYTKFLHGVTAFSSNTRHY